MTSESKMPSFPSEIRHFVNQCASPDSQKTSKDDDLIVQQATVKAFEDWSKTHEQFVRENPLLKTIADSLKDSQEGQKIELKGVAERIQSVATGVLKNKNALTHAEDIMKEYNNFQAASSSLTEIFNYYEAGFIDDKQLVQILSLRNNLGQSVVESNIKECMPHLKNYRGSVYDHMLTDKVVMEYVNHSSLESAVDFFFLYAGEKEHSCPLETDRGCKLAVDYLQTRTPEEQEIFFDRLKKSPEYLEKIASTKGSNQQTLLHHSDTLALMVPLLDNLEGPKIAELLLQRNDKGQIPLRNFGELEIATQLLAKCSKEDLKKIFDAKDNEGKEPLSNWQAQFYFVKLIEHIDLIQDYKEVSNADEFLEFFKNRNLRDLIVISYLDANKPKAIRECLVENDAVFDLILKALDTRPDEDVISFFEVKALDGESLIHTASFLEKILEHFKNKPELISELVRIEDAQGKNVLNKLDTLAIAAKYLEERE